MNVLLIGAGGREHALAYTLRKSPSLNRFFVAPGNPGIERLAKSVILASGDHEAVIAFCRRQAIDFVVIGPEGPLVRGLVDALEEEGIAAFGPSEDAALLEGSKSFAKEVCKCFAVPTAAYAKFTDAESAKAYVREQGAPIVVKADGLASGKGVVVAESAAEAEAAIESMFGGQFGEAGETVVIEEKLIGEEVSFFALCDGTRALPLGSAQDYKRLGDGDTGPNTGGMGAISPSPLMDEALTARVMKEIIEPVVAGMAELNRPFVGVLYAGLMLTADGPKVLEFNVRFGDPEAQALLPQLQTDLLPLFKACSDENMPMDPVKLSGKKAVTVVMAAPGYPLDPQLGSEIKGLDAVEDMPGIIVTQAGTKKDGKRLLADGGRVLSVTGIGADLAEAREKAYAAVAAIDWPEAVYRKDIGAGKA
ncbi:phosphoribosylamine--glycine ligase [Methyloferula stellata]|uniref:phosphoribosylamine--glycine ligase n=1 Tax=Methyloferula stellata TaxID=876270 RepID=UPI000376C155|nr:phosphoribosylamine--glycine ligase [Methyloferula stellata]